VRGDSTSATGEPRRHELSALTKLPFSFVFLTRNRPRARSAHIDRKVEPAGLRFSPKTPPHRRFSQLLPRRTALPTGHYALGHQAVTAVRPASTRERAQRDMNRLQLSHKLLSLCGLAMAVLALMTFVSHRSLETSDGTARMVVANDIQRAQMAAEMRQNAIRSQLLLIQAAGARSQKQFAQAGSAAVQADAERLRQELRRVAQAESPEVQKALLEVLPAVQVYLREAEALARQFEASLSRDSAAALPAPDSFDRAFTALEQRLMTLGESIQDWSQRINQEATESKSAANRLHLWVALLCAAILLALSLLLTLSIRSPLNAMARAARAVAEGDLEQTIDHSSPDELGELADALRMMIEYMRDTARAAESLGHGDLTVTVRPRSAKDTLSQSFLTIKTSLERSVYESSSLIAAARRGELSTRARADGLSGAFQESVAGMNALLEAVNAPLQEAKLVLTRVEARDLTARMTGAYDGDFAAIKSSLNGAVQTLEQAFGEVLLHADQVASAAAQITSGSANLAESASTQVATIGHITSALEETTSMSKQCAANAQESRAQAEGAMAIAEQGSKNMASLSAAVDAMKEAADETAKIVRTIDEIAFQTNLLALNAAVEAARAGDAGRGFAVVADEVRTLAMRSAEAARSTTQVIDRSLKKAEEGVAINREATVAFSAIANQVKKVVEVMKEIAESSRQQHAAVARVSAAVDSVGRDAETGAATAEEAASAAEQLSAQAELMRETTSLFQLGGLRGRVAGRPLRAVTKSRHANRPASLPQRNAAHNGASEAQKDFILFDDEAAGAE
jgi:methyl-accepting chemotaxis protein